MLDVALSRECGWQVQPHTRPYVLTRLVMQISSSRWTAGRQWTFRFIPACEL